MKIILKEITKAFGEKTVITPTSLTVESGSFTTLLGPSGCGKTTLLRMIAGLESPDTGEIWLDDQCVFSGEKEINIPPEKRNLGFVFQDCNLLDTLTAFENIALALTIRKTPPQKVERLVQETAQLLEITDCLNKYPYQMSGGQQQRTAAARAIVTRPALILADEPTGALDSKSARLLLERFEVMNELCEATILMVTHDAFTASYCHRILFLRDGAVFAQLERGDLDRRDFFRRIIGVVTELGGDQNDVL